VTVHGDPPRLETGALEEILSQPMPRRDDRVKALDLTMPEPLHCALEHRFPNTHGSGRLGNVDQAHHTDLLAVAAWGSNSVECLKLRNRPQRPSMVPTTK
jgi:hypothetical protein